MGFFKNLAIDKKYEALTKGADPVIRVVIPYHGKLSEITPVIADELYKQGAIALKKEQVQKPTEKPNK